MCAECNQYAVEQGRKGVAEVILEMIEVGLAMLPSEVILDRIKDKCKKIISE